MLIDLQNLILEMVARGTDLGTIADRICREVERLAPDVACSILSVDSRDRLHTLVAADILKPFSRALEGRPIGPQAGPCGIAARRGRDVVVTDIARDPLWDDVRELPFPAELSACWSSPIISGDRVVGTFAFYYREHRGPTDFEREIVARFAHLCQIALERDHRLQLNERLLYTDALTSLKNRASFEKAIAVPSPGSSALLLIDIDNLKLVNDTFGHHTGDCLIQEVARRIHDIVAPHAAFRIGGDELAVLTDTSEVVPLAERVLDQLRVTVECDGHILLPSATIGAAIRSIDDRSGTVMRQNADLALYHGKEDRGRGSLVLYAPELRTRMNYRLRAIDRLRHAIVEHRIEARYQPIVQLDTNAVRSFEALVRIRDAEGRLIPACDFQEAFVDARNAVEITRFMLRTVAADLRRWEDDGVSTGRVAINLAPTDFAHGRLVEEVQEIFDAAHVPLDRLALEITESVYLGRREILVQDQLTALRRLGVRLALDDFGTGFASLTHLLFTPVDTLKIDKSFVDTLGDVEDGDGGGAAVINGLMRIAEKLGIAVVAEGVETIGQREQLRALGCVLGQGFLFAAALPPDAADALLRASAPPLSDPPPPLDRVRSIHGSATRRAA